MKNIIAESFIKILLLFTQPAYSLFDDCAEERKVYLESKKHTKIIKEKLTSDITKATSSASYNIMSEYYRNLWKTAYGGLNEYKSSVWETEELSKKLISCLDIRILFLELKKKRFTELQKELWREKEKNKKCFLNRLKRFFFSDFFIYTIMGLLSLIVLYAAFSLMKFKRRESS